MSKKKGIISEFKEFIMRGNVIDMAVGVIIATAFGKITTSLVNDVVMPAIGLLIGDMDLITKLDWTVVEEVKDAAGEVITPAVTIGFGTFLSTIINFLLIALVIFITIKIMNKAREITEKKILRKKEDVEEVAEETPAPTSEELLTEILAELKKQNKE